MARSAILSIKKLIGSIPSVSPFAKGGQGDFNSARLITKPLALTDR
jgi:hypothetical protein